MVVVFAGNIRCGTNLRLKLRCRRGSCAVGTIPFVQISQNIGGFRQDKVVVLKDRHIVLTGNLVHLRAHPSAVGYDNSVIGQTQGGQFSADDLAVRAPVDMEESHSHNDIRLPGNGRKWNAHFVRMLKKASSFVLASSQRLNVRKKVRLASSFAAALLKAFLNILLGIHCSSTLLGFIEELSPAVGRREP